MNSVIADDEAAYRAVQTRDTRFDGQFVTAVRTTGIYCRPACPARTPLRHNVSFFPTPAAAQAAGYRACRRCLPDAAPGSPEWNLRADTVGAAMRLISDGVVDREGIPGLAARVGYTSRHLGRLLISEVGASPLALARARRAHTARVLLTTTDLAVSDIAFAAGFSSIRQFNDTVRQVFAADPSTLRARRHSPASPAGALTVRLAVRAPFAADELLAFLAARAIPGVERVEGRSYSRTVRLPAGSGVIRLELPAPDGPPVVLATLHLEQLADLVPAVDRCRRLVDADADPVLVDELLASDPLLAPSIHRTPGLRVPGAVDGTEMLARAVVGQQISVAAARAALQQLVAATGTPLPEPLRAADPALTAVFPSASRLRALAPRDLPGPARRIATLTGAAAALADGRLVVDPGRRSAELVADLTALPGIGPWTARYVAMRVLGDPDILLDGDLALRHGAIALGLPDDPVALAGAAQRWRPFRSYAGMHLWRSATTPPSRTSPDEGAR